MKDLSNDIVVQINKKDISFLQFRFLNKLGIKHAYTLKNYFVNFRHSNENFNLEIESYKKICNALNLDYTKIIKPKQSHTKNIKIIKNIHTSEILDDIDGLITNQKNIILSTTNADCILYLLFDPQKKVIGNIHSGWKGTYQGIIENALDKMVEEYGSNLKDIIVCICPSIRKCCFEVKKDVRDMFYNKYSYLRNINRFIICNERNKFFVDTVGINNCLMLKKGILKDNIYDSNICSMCNNDIIHSYRAEGINYKLATAIISL